MSTVDPAGGVMFSQVDSAGVDDGIGGFGQSRPVVRRGVQAGLRGVEVDSDGEGRMPGGSANGHGNAVVVIVGERAAVSTPPWLDDVPIWPN